MVLRTAPVTIRWPSHGRPGGRRALDRAAEDCHDSHGILLHLRDVLDGAPEHHDREPLAQADAIVTRYEYASVDSAVQRSGVEPLRDALRDLGAADGS
ncbi:hypothetical protein J8N05_04630 [Streptomyces sp. BH-SS-21]|uniref:Uncharacterized protein n=1 Tax=Streptomyces liliiviolaceus TaxID=2823109 RepID=A0A941B519_9ACTN|nr:hypothetical protein [Streptomyces liliiviolaceus]MBQ0847512.1 hypothetical protein [Streptomyces liliiviolaceus]